MNIMITLPLIKTTIMTSLEEEWRDTPVDKMLSRYRISNYGRIYNTLTMKYIKTSLDNHGCDVAKLLNNDDELITYNVSQLMLASFKPSKADHNVNGRIITVDYVKDEIWKDLPKHLNLRNYMASTEGRLYNVKLSQIVPKSANRSGYSIVTLSNDKGISDVYRVDALILESFVPKPTITRHR